MAGSVPCRFCSPLEGGLPSPTRLARRAEITPLARAAPAATAQRAATRGVARPPRRRAQPLLVSPPPPPPPKPAPHNPRCTRRSVWPHGPARHSASGGRRPSWPRRPRHCRRHRARPGCQLTSGSLDWPPSRPRPRPLSAPGSPRSSHLLGQRLPSRGRCCRAARRGGHPRDAPLWHATVGCGSVSPGGAPPPAAAWWGRNRRRRLAPAPPARAHPGHPRAAVPRPT